MGIPVAVLLSFVLSLRGKGLWIGILTGSSVQAIILALLTASTNWHKQVFNYPNLLGDCQECEKKGTV